MSELRVPFIAPDSDIYSAALKYADAGWYVGPLHPDDRKNPGRVLGKGWPAKTSRDRDTLGGWFVGTSWLLFLHVGRSGAWVADVDHPDQVPGALAEAIRTTAPPHQESRPDQPGRGHYVWRQPHGRTIGNSTGDLGRGFGEGRGRNGIIVVAPSPHKDEANGARYEWLQTGDVPVMPAELADLLPDAGESSDAATDTELREFVGRHTEARRPALLKPVRERFQSLIEDGASRHDSLVEAACWAARESMAGLYSARDAFDQLTGDFASAMSITRGSADRVLSRASAEAEACGAIAWAISQAKAEGEASRASRAGLRAGRLSSVRTDTDTSEDTVANGTDEAGSVGFVGINLESEFEPLTPFPKGPDPLPLDALGPVLGPLAEAAADAYQLPADAVVNMALPIITTAAHGGWQVQVDQGWTEPLALASVSCLGSGELKSPTLKLLDGPLRQYERTARAEAMGEFERQTARREVLQKAAELAKNVAVKQPDQMAGYLAALDMARDAVVTPLPRWLIDDATPQAAVSVLAEQGAVGIISAEPGLFGTLAGKYSNNSGPDIDWFLKSYSGESTVVDRISRDTEYLERPALSMAACIQPGRMSELGEVKAFRNSGLLARMLFVVPPSLVGTRRRPRPVPEDQVELWTRAIRAVATAGLKRRKEQVTLRLDVDGREVLEQLRAEVEPHLHPDHGKYAAIGDWMNKTGGFAIRIAGALTLLANPESLEIAEATMLDAVRLVRAYTSHAVTAFGALRPGQEQVNQAIQVLAAFEALTDSEKGEFVVSRRDVHRKLEGRVWVESAESLDPAIEQLVQRGYLAKVARTSNGGRPPNKYAVRSALPKDHPLREEAEAA